MHAVQEALGHEHEATTRHYLRAIAVEPDRYSAAIVKRLRLPERPADDLDARLGLGGLAGGENN